MSTNPYQSPESPPPRLKVRLSWPSLAASQWFHVGAAVGGTVGMLLSMVLAGFFMADVAAKRNGGMLTLPEWANPLIWWGPDILPAFPLAAFLLAFISGYWLWRRNVVRPMRGLCHAIVNHPTDPDHYIARGTLYLDETQQRDCAIADFSEALALKPDSWRACGLRGKAHVLSKSYELAIADLTQAILLATDADELTHDAWWLYDFRSVAHYGQEEFQRAIEDASEAIDLLSAASGGKKFALSAIYRRGMCHRRVGDRVSAKQDFRLAHRHDWFWLLEPRYGHRCFGMLVVSAAYLLVVFLASMLLGPYL